MQSSAFVNTNEADGDSETLAWASDHGLHCSGHHCARMGVSDKSPGLGLGLEEGMRSGRAGWRVLPRLLVHMLLCRVPSRLYCFGQVTLGASRKDSAVVEGRQDRWPHISRLFIPLFAVRGGGPESGDAGQVLHSTATPFGSHWGILGKHLAAKSHPRSFLEDSGTDILQLSQTFGPLLGEF